MKDTSSQIISEKEYYELLNLAYDLYWKTIMPNCPKAPRSEGNFNREKRRITNIVCQELRDKYKDTPAKFEIIKLNLIINDNFGFAKSMFCYCNRVLNETNVISIQESYQKDKDNDNWKQIIGNLSELYSVEPKIINKKIEEMFSYLRYFVQEEKGLSK